MTKDIVAIQIKLLHDNETNIAQMLCCSCPQKFGAMEAHQFSLILPAVVSNALSILFI